MTTGRWRSGAVGLLGALAALVIARPALAAGGSGPGRAVTAAPTPGPVEYALGDPGFYEVPEPIPAGTHGDLLRWQSLDATFSRRYRIMYLSETASGTPTVVTGLVELPDDQAPFGGFKALLYGHGSTGFDDPCSPSRVIDDPNGGDYADEFDSMSTAINDGWAVIATDYEGLGGPGSHPLLVGVSEGRSVLDAGRAARQLPVAYIGGTTAVFGFSQGGHAALWAAQLAAEWTPEQPIIGTVAVATPSEAASLVSWGLSQPQLEDEAVAVLAGTATANVGAAIALTQLLTPAGVELLASWEAQCFDVDPAVAGPYVTADPSTVEPFATLLAANTAGTVATPTPLLLFHGDADTTVPIAHSDALLARLCAAGQVVERRVVAGASHGTTIVQADTDGLAWLTGLAAGSTTPITTCEG
jgi:fermentation-respiration switch protein FrsA (DUF1100 family)